MASKLIEFHEDAAAEYSAAFDWYFDRSRLAALKFSQEMNSAILSISAEPSRWPVHVSGTRRFLFKHFPFSVVYRELPGKIQIVAVAHARRQPSYWAKRL
jgi:toxin ParE1/3/4